MGNESLACHGDNEAIICLPRACVCVKEHVSWVSVNLLRTAEESGGTAVLCSCMWWRIMLLTSSLNCFVFCVMVTKQGWTLFPRAANAEPNILVKPLWDLFWVAQCWQLMHLITKLFCYLSPTKIASDQPYVQSTLALSSAASHPAHYQAVIFNILTLCTAITHTM